MHPCRQWVTGSQFCQYLESDLAKPFHDRVVKLWRAVREIHGAVLHGIECLKWWYQFAAREEPDLQTVPRHRGYAIGETLCIDAHVKCATLDSASKAGTLLMAWILTN